MGVPHELLDAEGLAAHFPYLALPPGSTGVWERARSGYLSPRRLVHALVPPASPCPHLVHT